MSKHPFSDAEIDPYRAEGELTAGRLVAAGQPAVTTPERLPPRSSSS